MEDKQEAKRGPQLKGNTEPRKYARWQHQLQQGQQIRQTLHAENKKIIRATGGPVER